MNVPAIDKNDNDNQILDKSLEVSLEKSFSNKSMTKENDKSGSKIQPRKTVYIDGKQSKKGKIMKDENDEII